MTRLKVPLKPRVASRPRFRKGQGAYIHPKYRAWKEEAAIVMGAAWRRANLATVEGPVAVSILLHRDRFEISIREAPPDRSRKGFRGDIDNYIKAILDAAQDAGLIEDDRQIVDLTAEFASE
jgi:Holliday junction resolvase RusA-like endonuclease